MKYDTQKCHLQPAWFKQNNVFAIKNFDERSKQVLQMTMVLLTFAETKVSRT